MREKAIDGLVGQGIIKRENGMLAIAEGGGISRTVGGIMRFYDDVDRTVRRKLLFRGILNAALYPYLVHFKTFATLMETEGFSREDMDAVLDKDGSKATSSGSRSCIAPGRAWSTGTSPSSPCTTIPISS